jgi:hypothetical protein
MKQGQVRALAIAALVGSWLFTIDWLIAPLWQDHYRVLDEFVSEMGGGTANHPWIINGGILVWGIAILCAAAALYAVLPRDRWRAPILITLTLAGLAIAFAAFATMDCFTSVNHACYERWLHGRDSWHEVAHARAADAAGILFALSSLAVAGFLRSRGRGPLAVVPAVGGTLGLAWSILGLFSTPHFEPHAHWGLVQRVTILAATGWTQLLAGGVLIWLDEGRARRRERPSAAPPTWSAARPTQPSA